MSKGFITGTNEELIKAYKESRDESYLKELIEANKGLINLLVSPYLTSIPNSELVNVIIQRKRKTNFSTIKENIVRKIDRKKIEGINGQIQECK